MCNFILMLKNLLDLELFSPLVTSALPLMSVFLFTDDGLVYKISAGGTRTQFSLSLPSK